MEDTKKHHLFDIHTIMNDIEKVIEKGLNKLLINYIERHELLEKTHKQLIQLPSIVEELNKRSITQPEMIFNDSDSETGIEKCTDIDFINIKDMTENIVCQQISSLQNKLDKMEKKYDAIIPILDKLIGKIHHLNDDIKGLQNNNEHKFIEKIAYKDTIENSPVVKSCENENIKIYIKEYKELEEVISDDCDVVKPELITHSTISVKKEVNTQSIDIKKVNVDNLKKETEEKVSTEKEVEEEEEEEEEEEGQQSSVETAESKAVNQQETDNEEASVETETKEDDEEGDDEDDEEIFEIDIDDKTYCTNDDENGFIWELNEDGEQGDKVGYFKESEPFFYAEEN